LCCIVPLYDDTAENRLWLSDVLHLQATLFDSFEAKLSKEIYAKSSLKLCRLLAQLPIIANSVIERLADH
jgi:hypothetical protein